MILVREHIYEKFVEDSDPITDLGIGLPHLILKQLDDFDDLNRARTNPYQYALDSNRNIFIFSIELPNSSKKMILDDITDMLKQSGLLEYFVKKPIIKIYYYSNSKIEDIDIYFMIRSKFKKIFNEAYNELS